MHVILGTIIGTIAAVVQAEEKYETTIDYRFTARDFLFAGCVKQEAIEAFWPEKYNSKGDLVKYNVYEGDDRKNQCPVWKDIEDGKTFGHPDFEPLHAFYANGASGFNKTFQTTVLYNGVPNKYSWNCNITDIVEEELGRDPSGIPIVAYYDDPIYERNGVCFADGQKGEHATTGKDSFDQWFRDVKGVNKRIGFVLSLKRDESKEIPTFVYDSALDSSTGIGGYYPLNSSLPCNVNDGVEDCSNGGVVWPWSAIESGYYAKFGFTTEHHSFFTYRGNEVFEFSGDDDVWVFINNKLAVDLGGLHPPFTTATYLAQNEERLGLIQNKTYSIDIFHAERHTDASNFKITTSLFQKCNVQTSGEEAFSFENNEPEDFVYTGMRFDAPYGKFNGKDFLLTMASFDFISSYVFYKEQINVGAGFVINFEFTVDSTVGDSGMALVLHRRPEKLSDINGGASGNLGFSYFSNSLVVAFDFCWNRADANSDCSTHRVGLHYPDSPEELNSHTDKTEKFYSPLVQSFKNGFRHSVLVKYYEDPTYLEVYIDESLYLLDKDMSIENVIGGRDAYVGLTGATGENSNGITIHSFSANTVQVDPTETKIVPGNVDNFYDDGESPLEYKVVTKDKCKNDIENGGFADFAVGVLIRTDNSGRRLEDKLDVIPAETVDNGDGTYSLLFTTTETGTFDLISGFGNCMINPNATSVDNVFIAKEETKNTTLFPECWTESVPNAGTAVEAPIIDTAAPTKFPTKNPFILPEEAAIGVGTGGAIFLCCGGGIIAYMIVAYKRKWHKNKFFIGKDRDKGTEGSNMHLTALQMEIQNTNQELNRARQNKEDFSEDINKEKTLIDQLRNQVYEKKKNVQQAEDPAEVSIVENPEKKRKEFQVNKRWSSELSNV